MTDAPRPWFLLAQTLENLLQEAGRAGRDGGASVSRVCWSIKRLPPVDSPFYPKGCVKRFCQAANTACRRQLLLAHFGEQGPAPPPPPSGVEATAMGAFKCCVPPRAATNLWTSPAFSPRLGFPPLLSFSLGSLRLASHHPRFSSPSLALHPSHPTPFSPPSASHFPRLSFTPSSARAPRRAGPLRAAADRSLCPPARSSAAAASTPRLQARLGNQEAQAYSHYQPAAPFPRCAPASR